MKKSKLKSPKRKVISHRYQKNSNTSLSKLLHIASYKKRIRDLLINNRRLARELQTAKCEMAAQNSLLEDDAKNRNQVMLARRKIGDMAIIINKLVAEMDEIRNYLDNVLSSNEMKFRSKRFLHPKKVVPTVDCIEEVSVLSSSDPSFSQNTPPPPDLSVQINPSYPASGKTKYSDEMLLANLQSDDPESCEVSVSLPPILFVEDNGGEFQETNVKKSSKNNSSGQDKGDNRSLTPELDIDLSCFRRKKSNSRRQTQFKLSNPRKTKSKGKSSSTSSPLLLSPRENCQLPMEASSNSCRTKVSNSRKTKSRGKTSLEAKSALLESQPLVCDSLSSDSCQSAYSVSDAIQSKFKNKSSPGVISPSLQCEEIFVQASHSTKQVSGSIKTRSKGKRSETDLLLLQSEQMTFEASNNQRKTCVKITNFSETKSKGKSAASPMLECDKTDENQQYEDFNSSHSSEQHESLDYSSNLHCIIEKKLPNCSNNLLTSDMPSNCATFKILPDSNIKPLAAIPNQTLLLSEDMELTDVIATNPIILEYDTVNKDRYYSEIKSNIPENSNYSRVNNKSEKEPPNMGEILESFVENNKDLPTVINDNIHENVVMEQNKISEINKGNMPLNQSLLISPAKKRRSKGGVQYCVFFSSSEPSDSEDEYVPGTSKPRKKRRSSSSEKRATAIFKPDTNLKASVSNNSSVPEENIAVHETSIFSFNVSHSEKDDINKNSINTPKKSKLSRNKKSNKKNDVSMKPLSQNCNVTKLKGFNYKFSKTKSPIRGKKLSKGKREKKSDSSSNMYTSVVTDGSLKNSDTSKLLTNVSQDKFSSFHVKDMTKSVQNACKGALKDLSISESAPSKQDSSFESVQTERKRVSFAATDLVCKFKKMSLAKAIGANSKVRRISKSVAELDLFEEDISVQLPSFEKLNDAEDSLFDFDGETVLYSTNSTSNDPNPASLETDLRSPPKSTISSNVGPKAILYTENLTNRSNKREKVLKKKVVASQKKLLQTASPVKNIPEDLPKKDVTEKSPSLNKVKDSKQLPCSDKQNDTKDSLFDFSDLTDLHSVNFTSDVLCPAPQAVDQQPPSNIDFLPAVEPSKEMLDTDSERLINENEKILKIRVASSEKRLPTKVSPAKKIPGVKSLPVQTSKKSVKLYKDLKENYISNHLDTVRIGKQSKQRCPLSPIQPFQDDLKDRCIDTDENKLISSAKCKKRVTKKFAKSGPVLKRDLNIKCSLLGIDAPTTSVDVKDIDGRPKRRSKAVFYKEVPLNTKMRRT